jgi:4-carboxymuconolactone decarboxylase
VTDDVEKAAGRGDGVTDDEVYERGMAVRRAVLGDAHVDRAAAGADAFSAGFQEFLTRYAWGEVWQRPGLDRRTRSAVTLAVLTALRAEDEIGMHVRGALRNGLTEAEISEVLLHVAIYAGLPAARSAYRIAGEVLAQERETPDH